MNAKLAALLEEQDELRDVRLKQNLPGVPLTVFEYDLLREALREREGMVMVPREFLHDFTSWARPSKRDWENAAVRDEFDSMQEKARRLLAAAEGK